MMKNRPSLMLLLCTIGIMTIIASLVKYLYTQLIFFNSGLLVVLIITVFVKKDIVTYCFSAISIGLIVYSLSSFREIRTHELVIQQVLAVVAVIVTTVLIIIIKRLYRSINNERVQLDALFKYAPLGIIISDSKEEIVLMNPAALQLFGYLQRDVVGMPVRSLLPERLHAGHLARRSHYNKLGHGESSAYNIEIVAVKKNGDEFPMYIRLNSYANESEYHVVAFVDDVTMRKAAAKEMTDQKDQLEKVTHDVRRMNTELENKVAERTLILREALLELEKSQTELSESLSKEKELNEIKSRFVSMASHEFRTPLSAILSSAALLSRYHFTEEQEKRDKHIRRIKGSVNHLNLLLEDFLSLGKLEEGRMFVQAEIFDVKEILLDIFDEMKLTLKQGQHIELAYNGEASFVTDKRLLKNILINLLSNAGKFSDENKAIQVAVENSGARLIIQVKDHGIGIAREDMPYMFTTFYRGANAVNIQGTGLGLHIVKRYIGMLEGGITLSSEIGNGCTFNIGLPNLQEMLA